MGEKKEQPKNETAKKPDEGAKNDAPAPIVYKLDLHCEGCIKKIKRTVRHFEGVENVKAELEANKVTVTGKFDAVKLQAKIAEKTKKKVDLVSAPPKKDAGAGEKSPEKKPEEKKSDEKKSEEKKSDEKKPEEKKPKESTVVMKIRLHCDGCINKIKKMILKFKGVESVNLDGDKDLVTVKGTMDAKELVAYVTEKTKRNVDVVPPKKEEDKKEKEGGGEKKEKEKDNKDKKDEGAVAAAAAKVVEVNKMEYQYPLQTPPMYWYDGQHEQGASSSSSSYGGYGGYGGMEVHHEPMYNNHYMEPSGYHVMNQGYPMQPPPQPFYMQPHPPPQMFSDENPNACSVM
ncbi:heavy metal-associated isoprenylated plant protein 3-like [Lotus japonicus]|uniref:heavy metal-associated isoprenylated plant protein 3-like n=1 Tax=Lotus japonicus TaxID=34305 RepID=UPI002585EA5B|nr:heavy metal-associated isoprenylated plant protein 3-like [Lotus japonicus]